MLAPKLIGFASETSWYGLPYGVLVTAGVWAAQGLRVLVVDAEPADLALTSLAHAQPQRGSQGAFVDLLRDRGVWPSAVDVSETLRAVLDQGKLLGSVSVVPAYDNMPSRRPAAPGASVVRAARDRLQRVELGGRVADVVLVSLPPLDSPFGVAVAANLLDALVLITSAKAPALRRAGRSLAELGARRGEAMPVHLCERMGAQGREDARDDAAWLHHLKALPELTFYDLTPPTSGPWPTPRRLWPTSPRWRSTSTTSTACRTPTPRPAYKRPRPRGTRRCSSTASPSSCATTRPGR